MAGLGEFSYAVPLKQRERHSVVDQILCLVQCRHGPARKNACIAYLERVQIGLGNNAAE
jgi:hypothetical protein